MGEKTLQPPTAADTWLGGAPSILLNLCIPLAEPYRPAHELGLGP